MAKPTVRGHRNQKTTEESNLPSQILIFKLENGKRYAHTAASKYQITMASLQPDEKRAPNCFCNVINESKKLGSKAMEDKDKVTVIIEHDLKEYILCILDQTKMRQCKLDLMIKPGEQVAFKAIGSIPVQLTGILEEAH